MAELPAAMAEIPRLMERSLQMAAVVEPTRPTQPLLEAPTVVVMVVETVESVTEQSEPGMAAVVLVAILAQAETELEVVHPGRVGPGQEAHLVMVAAALVYSDKAPQVHQAVHQAPAAPMAERAMVVPMAEAAVLMLTALRAE